MLIDPGHPVQPVDLEDELKRFAGHKVKLGEKVGGFSDLVSEAFSATNSVLNKNVPPHLTTCIRNFRCAGFAERPTAGKAALGGRQHSTQKLVDGPSVLLHSVLIKAAELSLH